MIVARSRLASSASRRTDSANASIVGRMTSHAIYRYSARLDLPKASQTRKSPSCQAGTHPLSSGKRAPMRKCAFGVISAIAYLIVGSCFNRLLALDFPEFGFRFRCETGVNLNGWECVGGGFYPKKRISPGTVVTSKNLEEFMECCVDTFYPFRKTNSENRFRLAKKVMLVRTKPLTHGSQGGIE